MPIESHITEGSHEGSAANPGSGSSGVVSGGKQSATQAAGRRSLQDAINANNARNSGDNGISQEEAERLAREAASTAARKQADADRAEKALKEQQNRAKPKSKEASTSETVRPSDLNAQTTNLNSQVAAPSDLTGTGHVDTDTGEVVANPSGVDNELADIRYRQQTSISGHTNRPTDVASAVSRELSSHPVEYRHVKPEQKPEKNSRARRETNGVAGTLASNIDPDLLQQSTPAEPADQKQQDQQSQPRNPVVGREGGEPESPDNFFNRLFYRNNRRKIKENDKLKPKKQKTHGQILAESQRDIRGTLDYQEANSKLYPNERRYESQGGEQGYTLGQESNDITYQESIRKAEQAVTDIADSFKFAVLPLKSLHIDEEGHPAYSDAVMNIIRQEAAYFGIDMRHYCQLVILASGMTLDSNSLMFKREDGSAELNDEFFFQIANQIHQSQVQNGHPLGLVSKSPLYFKDSYHFPLGVMPVDLAQALTVNAASTAESGLKDVSPSELAERARKSWVYNTQPVMRQVTSARNQVNQRYAIEYAMRAICNLDGIDPVLFGVRRDVPRTFADIYETKRQAEQTYNDPAVSEVQNRELRDQERKLMRNMGRKPIYQDGQIVGFKDQGKIYRCLSLWNNFTKTMGIMDPIFAASGLLEKAVGEAYGFAANQVLLAMGNNEDIQLSQRMKDNFSNQEFIDALGVLSTLFGIGEFDAVNYFIAHNYPFTRAGIVQMQKELQGNSGPVGKVIDKGNAWMAKITNAVIPADYAFRSRDAKRFVEGLVIQQAALKESGQAYMSTQEIEEAMARGPENFFRGLMTTPTGQQAFIMTRANTLGRISPASHLVGNWFRNHPGFYQAFATMTGCRYPEYSVRFLETLIPFSNSLSYLITKGYTKQQIIRVNARNAARKAETEANGQEFTAYDAEAMPTIANYQMGGNLMGDNFFDKGLQTNLMYDSIRFGGGVVMAMIVFGILQAFDLEEPEDEMNIFNIDEYTIALPDGTRRGFKLGWWMNDIIGGAWPVGVASAVFMKYGPERAWGVFCDGCADMMAGTAIMDALDLITNGDRYLGLIDNYEDDGTMPNPAILGNLMTNTVIARQLKFATPAILNNWYRDTLFVGSEAYAADPDRVYNYSNPLLNREDYTEEQWNAMPDYEKYRTVAASDEDAFFRRLSRYNVLYGTLLNFARDLTAKEQFTGYTFFDMPPNTNRDPIQWASYEELEIDDDTFENMTQEQKDQASFELLQYLSTFETPGQYVALGKIIPYNRRTAAIQYCYDRILDEYIAFNQNQADGMYNTSAKWNAAKNEMQSHISEYYRWLEDWLQNDNVPWSAESYRQYLTDTNVSYRRTDTGESVDGFTAQILRPFGLIEETYFPYGNHPTSSVAVTLTDDRGQGGYNFENVPDWYDPEFTDTQALYDSLVGKTFGPGRFEGQDMASVIFPNGPDEAPVTGVRGFETEPQGLPDSLKNMSLEMMAEARGEDLDELKDGTKSSNRSKTTPAGSTGPYYGSYRSYSSRSGGSYGYNPKIYYTNRNVTADRAASMYTKQPYGPTISYLRPSFQTKGSREAYKRSDI